MAVQLKVSKPGFEVMVTGNANLAFNAALATHSIYNIISMTKGSGVTSVAHNHNLGYIPKTWVFLIATDADGEHYRRIPMNEFDRIDYYVTSTQIVIQTDSSSTAYNFKVIIFTRSPNP